MSEPGPADVRLLDAAAALGRHPARDVGPGTPSELLAALDRYGIAEAVVAHSVATHHDAAAGNARVVADTSEEPRLTACWTVLPSTCGELPDPAVLVSRARANGVLLLTARPGPHGYDLAGHDLAPLLEAASEEGMPIRVDVPDTGWPALDHVAAAHPELRLILSDVGYRELRRLCGLMERHQQITLCTANLSGHLALEFMVDKFGADRLVFGTGYPVRDPAEAVTRLMWSELDEDAVRAVGGDTMRRLLAGPESMPAEAGR